MVVLILISQSQSPRLIKDPGPMEVSEELDHLNLLTGIAAPFLAVCSEEMMAYLSMKGAIVSSFL